MVTIRIVLLSVLALLISTTARAEPVLSVGVGKGILYHDGTPFERSFAAGYQFNLPVGVFIRPEAGYFLDISGKNNSSMWVAPMLGVQASSPVGAKLHIGVGPGYLQNPDNILGGHFQFSLEGGIGLEDSNIYVGLVWKHLSSAGINMPNQGRDFIMVQIRLLAL